MRFQLSKDAGENFRPDNQTDAKTPWIASGSAILSVKSREDRPTRTKPGAPFITSTLQQAASTRLGFSVKKTMTLAQRLYEAGYITYMRTDSTNLSAEAVTACREMISEKYGERYLPEAPNVYVGEKRCAGSPRGHPAFKRWYGGGVCHAAWMKTPCACMT